MSNYSPLWQIATTCIISEDPDVEGFFDYRLRSGATTARNAIRLLARMGFPDEVVKNAMTFVSETVKP